MSRNDDIDIIEAALDDADRPPVSGEPRRDLDALLAILPTADSPLPDQRTVKEWVPRVAEAADKVRERIIEAEASTGAALNVANEIKAILNRLPEARANPIWYEPTNGPDTRIKGMFAPLLARLAETAHADDLLDSPHPSGNP